MIVNGAFKRIWTISETRSVPLIRSITDLLSITKPLRMNLLMQAINKCATLGSLVSTMNIRGDDPLPFNAPKVDGEALEAVVKSRERAATPTLGIDSASPRKQGHRKRASTSGQTSPGAAVEELEFTSSRRLEVAPLLRFHST